MNEPMPPATPSMTSGTSGADDWKTKMPTGIRTPIVTGLGIVGLFVFGFGIWGATVPISGAAVASGVVAASGLNQEINHLEGGLISKILVNEGQRIRQGDILFELDQTRAMSERDRVRNQLLGLRARLVRAVAERDDEGSLVFEPDLMEEAGNLGKVDDLRQQEKEFLNRLDRHRSELAVLGQRKQAILDEISGLEVQEQSEITKLEVIRDELAQKKSLLDRGLTPRSQYNALQRAEADSVGRIGSFSSSIARRKTALTETETEVLRLEARRREEAASQINNLRLEINDLEEQLRSRQDILERISIRAPADGVVVKLHKNTIGSVIQPGETIAEILPTNTELIIEAKVPPQDIDVVRQDQKANVRFVALNARTTPEVTAVVTYVSADRLVDPDTRAPYFLARLELTGELPEPLTRDQIYPGMPVDAFIGTGERTFFEYLARPISDSFSRAFREQ